MKVFLAEAGSELVSELLAEDGRAASSRLAFVECQAALARGSRDKRLTRAQLTSAMKRLGERWEEVMVIELDTDLMRRAGQLVHEHSLRASDAVHLASARSLAAGSPEDTGFACWDTRLWTAGAREGFRMAPTALPA